MKKALPFIFIFCLMVYPRRQSNAQSDSVHLKIEQLQKSGLSTDKKLEILSRKDSSISVKINDGVKTVYQEIKRIKESAVPNRVFRFRPRLKPKIQIDSFFVYVDTCFYKNDVIHTKFYPDTIWMERNRRTFGQFIRDIFKGKKKSRVDKLEVVQ